ncbi:MAG: XRE family transcriptional regulator [Gammaproteobacteria bacterium]|jgi:transcriptional regulator with XRE-family HTH domain|nr:XRE family transcriptional regulator [Gammaproteobacteria bacterium]
MSTIIPPPNIGKIIRDARKSLGLTLERLAERSGVSRSMLSAIERGTANPTFAIVWSLAQSLGLDLSVLEGESRQHSPVEHLHAYSTPMRRSADGCCELYMLSPRRTVLPVEWYRLVMQTGGVLQSDAHAFGTFEHLTCLTGSLSVTLEEQTIIAQSGDTLRYRADCAHSIVNLGSGLTEAVLVVAQPSQFQAKPVTA